MAPARPAGIVPAAGSAAGSNRVRVDDGGVGRAAASATAVTVVNAGDATALAALRRQLAPTGPAGPGNRLGN